MDEERFNKTMRQFLKKVGVTSQREIEEAVRVARENGTLTGNEALKAQMLLNIDQIGLELIIEDDIELE